MISVRAAKAKLVIAEVASFEYRRRSGVSNLRTFQDGGRVLATIVRERVTPSVPGSRYPLGWMNMPTLRVGRIPSLRSG